MASFAENLTEVVLEGGENRNTAALYNNQIRKELENYSKDLLKKKEVIVLNKVDLLDKKEEKEIIKKFSKNKKIFINLLYYFISFSILSLINYQTSTLGLSSLVIFNAAIITIIYFELAIFLEKTFWDDFLGNSLPRSINLLISFVVMMNFGYFTLMFYIKVLDINYFVS